ncbi:biopolymer transporter ExbD [Longibacter salinarum]|uniref:Biopolymer transporter ExbD n=1 Tax=Longibacter salinarum TaxID=1850348 RepID=A0A2A8CW97_9BACT|nr:biopolymer transporter ExbD [Longibacter salinarum]PEN12881.1 biopolymer transporter ExbD [Longibacter salinarum]
MAGLLDKRREGRDDVEIPTASMADIAFLLLIFFLVTTTINVDTGIGMTLPPKLDQEQQPPPVKERNLFKILVNSQGDVLIEGELASLDAIRDRVKEQVLNYGSNPDLSENPSKSVISIKTDAETPYRIYVKALDEVMMGFREIYDSVARSGNAPSGDQVLQQTYSSYQEYRTGLEPEEEDQIREAIPRNISIAEPDLGDQQ